MGSPHPMAWLRPPRPTRAVRGDSSLFHESPVTSHQPPHSLGLQGCLELLTVNCQTSTALPRGFAPFPCYTHLAPRPHMISFQALRHELRPTIRLALPLS